MFRTSLLASALLLTVTGCNTIGQLGVRDYASPTGERVMAGLVAPKTEYNCNMLVQEPEQWGFSATVDKAASIQKVTKSAVDKAPAKSANYAHVMIPSESRVMGWDVNAFKSAQVAYYKCENLPATQLKS